MLSESRSMTAESNSCSSPAGNHELVPAEQHNSAAIYPGGRQAISSVGAANSNSNFPEGGSQDADAACAAGSNAIPWPFNDTAAGVEELSSMVHSSTPSTPQSVPASRSGASSPFMNPPLQQQRHLVTETRVFESSAASSSVPSEALDWPIEATSIVGELEGRKSPSPGSGIPGSTTPLVQLPESVDVVIIGAGPAGLTLACELARRNVRFLLFDVNPRAASHSRALLLQSRTLEVLAELGLAEPVVLNGHTIRGGRVLVDGRQVADLKFSAINGPFPFVVSLDQAFTEHLLLERLRELGGRVARPMAVWRIELPQESPTVPSAPGTPLCGGDWKYSAFPATSMAALLATHETAGVGGAGQPSIMTSFTPGASLAGFKRASSIDECSSPSSRPQAVAAAWQQQHQPFDQQAHYPCTIHVKQLDNYGLPIESAPGHRISCRYVVGCDGARSSVRKAVEIPFDCYGPQEEFLVSDVTAAWGDRCSFQRNRIQILQWSRGSLICIPMTDGRWRTICTRPAPTGIEAAAAAAAGTTESGSSTTENDSAGGPVPEPFTRLIPPEPAELQQILATLVPDTVLETVHWTAAFSLSCRIARTFCKAGAILVGDAAHVHPPSFCQGMNSGIQDAHNLAWKLASVLGGANPQLLESYSTERRTAAEEISRYVNKCFGLLTQNDFATRCFVSAVAPLVGSLDFFSSTLARNFTQIGLKYPQSPVVGPNMLGRSALVCPGDRMPDSSVVVLPITPDEYYPLSEVPRCLYTLLRDGSHTLLLILKVLPPGTKVKTIFGCERAEEAARWDVDCLERLGRLSRRLIEAFRGSCNNTNMANTAASDSAGLTVIWVLSNLVNFRSPANTVGLGQIRDHVPHRLKYFFFHESRIRSRSVLAVDYEGALVSNLGLQWGEPGTASGKRCGAFVLIRPDAHVAFNGFAGDANASAAAFDYAFNLAVP